MRRRVHLEVVILRRHRHPPGAHLAHGMIGAVVAKEQSAGAPARGQPQNLVAETDAHQRYLLLPDQRPRQLHQTRHALRIARPVGEQHAIGLDAMHIGEGHGMRRDDDLQPASRQTPGDVLLVAGVNQQHTRRARWHRLIRLPDIRVFGRDIGDHIEVGDGMRLLRLGHQRRDYPASRPPDRRVARRARCRVRADGV